MLNKMQQRDANRLKFSDALPFGMGKLEARQEHRRLKLLELRGQHKTSAAFSSALGEGFSASYVSQLLSGHRGIGDDVAEKIENRLGVPGWFDQSDTIETLTHALARQIEAASPEVQSAIMALLMSYQTDQARGDETARAIKTLLGVRNGDPRAG